MARFGLRDSRYRQAIFLRDIPWAIPLQDLTSAFSKQGIIVGNIERFRNYVRVEVLIFITLLFYHVTKFMIFYLIIQLNHNFVLLM